MNAVKLKAKQKQAFIDSYTRIEFYHFCSKFTEKNYSSFDYGMLSALLLEFHGTHGIFSHLLVNFTQSSVIKRGVVNSNTVL